MAVLSHTELETLWVLNGGSEVSADTAAAIAQAESGARTDAILNTAYPNRPNYHPPAKGNLPEFSVGLWQINIYAHKQYTEAAMLTEAGNVQAALALSVEGSDFHPWSTFTTTDPNRTYLRFLTGTVSTTPQQGPTFTTTGSQTASGHRGYADLRNSVARHLPTQLLRSRRTGAATLQLLAHGRKVKG
jgi:Lysozyme like domain